MKLIIYPGLQKTATSYFQLFCKSNHSLLKRRCKISYLLLENIFIEWGKSEQYASNHNKIAAYFADYSSSFTPLNKVEMETIEEIIISELRQGYNLVLCAEDLSRQVNLDSISSFLDRIKSKSQADIIIGMVLRDPLQWAQSMYNQYNKLRLMNFLNQNVHPGVLELSVNGLAQFLKQQSYFRLLNQKNLIKDWKTNLNSAQILPLNYSVLSKNKNTFAVEILCSLFPEAEETFREITEHFHYPENVNTNISNEWLVLFYDIINYYQTADEARDKINLIMRNYSDAKLDMSGSYILENIDLIDTLEFNINPYF